MSFFSKLPPRRGPGTTWYQLESKVGLTYGYDSGFNQPKSGTSQNLTNIYIWYIYIYMIYIYIIYIWGNNCTSLIWFSLADWFAHIAGWSIHVLGNLHVFSSRLELRDSGAQQVNRIWGICVCILLLQLIHIDSLQCVAPQADVCKPNFTSSLYPQKNWDNQVMGEVIVSEPHLDGAYGQPTV